MIPIHMKQNLDAHPLYDHQIHSMLFNLRNRCEKYYHYSRCIAYFIYEYPPADGVQEKLRMQLFEQRIPNDTI